jgi:hypothetical protein
MAKKQKDDDEKRPETSDGSIAANDAWTGLLAVSFLALAIGSGFLAYDYMKYSDGEPPKTPKISSSPAQPVVPPKDGGGKGEDKGKEKDKEKKKEETSLRLPSFDALALAMPPKATAALMLHSALEFRL